MWSWGSYRGATCVSRQSINANPRIRSIRLHPRAAYQSQGMIQNSSIPPLRNLNLHSSLQEQISENLNYLFGIAFSADDEPSLRIMACHALCACSAWIDDPLAQNLLFDLLRRTERDNGWPWAYVEQRILHAWQQNSR
jgi:hypothetical protein